MFFSFHNLPLTIKTFLILSFLTIINNIYFTEVSFLLKTVSNPTIIKKQAKIMLRILGEKKPKMNLPIKIPKTPPITIGKIVLIFISFLFEYTIIETIAQGIKNNRFVPCATNCSVFLNKVRYRIRTPPPPRPIELIIAEIIIAIISIILIV